MKDRILKLSFSCLIVIIGLLSSCSNGNEIIASSKIKNITRNDFYTWLNSKKIEKKTILDILDNKNKQKRLLESMAFELFLIDKAELEGFSKSKKLLVLK